jgi:hypothetical protein
MNALEFNQSIVNYANRDWQSVAAAVALAHRTETTDARISASAAIAASTRAVGALMRAMNLVIASAAKQSSFERRDCFTAFAMTIRFSARFMESEVKQSSF